MTSLNLTRTEALDRGRLAVERYDVVLDLTTGDKVFRSDTTVTFACSDPGDPVRIDLQAEAVLEVELNGERLDPDGLRVANGLRLTGLQQQNVLRVVADCRYTHTGEGLHRFVDPVDGAVYLYTQFESNDAHRVFACFDQPDLKAVFGFTVTAPAEWVVISNEPVVSAEPAGDGITRTVFQATPRVSTYITALVAGPYHSITDTYRRDDGSEIALGLFCRESLAEFVDADEIFTLTKQGFQYFEREFGRPYPFTKYDQLAVAEFNAGAMENAGCVTFHEDYFVFRSKVTDALKAFRANTILHEMAHMWFGDLVTMQWWDDLWLNESFAEYMAYQAAADATRFSDAWTAFATGRKAWGYRQDQLPSTHPIVADAPDIETVRTNFDGITYAKGASVLRQLVAWVGHERFIEGLRAYFDKHAWGNTRLSDLLVELEAASGRDLTQWAKEWLETAQCNTLRPRVAVADDGTYESVAVLQEAVPEHPTLRSHRIGIGLYDLHGDTLVRRDGIELDVAGAVTEVPELTGVRQPDLLLLNDGDLTFAKIRLDERSLETLTAGLGRLEDSLARALCWSAAWDMTRDAQMRPRDFVTLVANSLASESDMTTVQTVLRQAASTLALYVAPEHREESRTELAAALRAISDAAEPGSDRQLATVRALADLSRTEAELAHVRGILEGTVVLEGLALDPEMRWALVRALVRTGAADASLVDAEQELDPTANGARQAATARASIPTAEAKAAAWSSVVEQDALPNALQEATIGGFADPDQPDLLRPYVDAFFAAIGQVWESRTTDMAINVAVGMYPAMFVEQAIVDRTNDYVATQEPPQALARLLLEGAAGVERALAAQAADRA